MHPAVEASLGKDKQSDGKTLEDVMRQTQNRNNYQVTRLSDNSENGSM